MSDQPHRHDDVAEQHRLRATVLHLDSLLEQLAEHGDDSWRNTPEVEALHLLRTQIMHGGAAQPPPTELAEAVESVTDFLLLIERSSLGTPASHRIRRLSSARDVAAILARADTRPRKSTAPEQETAVPSQAEPDTAKQVMTSADADERSMPGETPSTAAEQSVSADFWPLSRAILATADEVEIPGLANLDRAFALAADHLDTTQQAYAHQQLAVAWARHGDDRRALDHARHGLDLYRALGQPLREARVLNTMSGCAARLGELDTALDLCRAAFALFRQHYVIDEAATLDNLGFIAQRSGDYQQAVDCYLQCLALHRSLDDADKVASTLESAGHPYVLLGQHGQARAMWREALELYREQGRDTDAERVQQQLHILDATPRPSEGAMRNPSRTPADAPTAPGSGVDREKTPAGRAPATRQIFLNYRASDEPFGAAFFDSELSREFGPDAVFFSARSVSPGVNWESAVFNAISASDVLLVIIGPHWLTATNESGQRRLDDPEDFVRREIELGLQLGKPVVPVHLGRRHRLDRSVLPDSLRELAYKQSMTVAFRNSRPDLGQLVAHLRQQVPQLDPHRSSR